MVCYVAKIILKGKEVSANCSEPCNAWTAWWLSLVFTGGWVQVDSCQPYVIHTPICLHHLPIMVRNFCTSNFNFILVWEDCPWRMGSQDEGGNFQIFIGWNEVKNSGWQREIRTASQLSCLSAGSQFSIVVFSMLCLLIFLDCAMNPKWDVPLECLLRYTITEVLLFLAAEPEARNWEKEAGIHHQCRSALQSSQIQLYQSQSRGDFMWNVSKRIGHLQWSCRKASTLLKWIA